MTDIAANVQRIRAEIAAAAVAAGRNPAEIQLCAATKMNDAAAVKAAVAAGVDCCGENRVQELLEKYPQGAYTGAPVHFIGHLQKNKAKQVVGAVDLIQSVDSEPLLALIDRLAAQKGIVQKILLEVNIGGEASKSGLTTDEAAALAAKMAAYPAVSLRGFMAIPPISSVPGENRQFFQKMHTLYVDIKEKKYDNAIIECLSMGMSGDFADAIACGSTMVRVGTAIFGPRNYNI